MTLRVLHLVGSAVSDFHCDLSRLYARDCLAATDDPGAYETFIAYVKPDQRWRFPTDLSDASIAAAPALRTGAAIEHLDDLRIDVAVPQMFCVPGMTHYRALLDVIGIPYVGNTPEAMALTADKARARTMVAAAGVRVPRGEVLAAGERPAIVPPAVVKPVDADNSLGVALVRRYDEYAAALASALEHAGTALVEDYVELGREVRCGVLERDGQLVCLPLEEYAVDDVRSYDDKLRRDDAGDMHLVAKDPSKAWIVDADDPINEPVWDAARTCHQALDCRHYSLFDFRIDADGTPWFLEAGLYCSFASQSVVATMAAAAGIELPGLFALALEGARA